MADHRSTRQLKRAELTEASTSTPRPDTLEESSERVSESPLLLPSSDSWEKINVSSASGANSDPSASSTSVIGNNYYVFLSFRGPDTRNGFVDHLYRRLRDVGLRFNPDIVFRDDENLPFGEDIAANLISAIKHSKVSIPVISENYAASEWCLRELIQIMECVERGEQKVLPVLYKVEPNDVRNMLGKFGDAFRRRKHRFDKELKQRGREALRKAADSRVFESEKFANGREGELVNELVEITTRELQHDFSPPLPVDLVGIDNHVAEVINLVDPAAPETRIIGIHGMGGIGKTTLATIIYKKLFDKFDWRSFLKDIRETIKCKGMEHVQSLLISDITKHSATTVRDSDTGIMMIQSSCKEKKVLILLDDVDRQDHLDKLIGGCSFKSGSRILVTCRDKALLENPRYVTYELTEMNSRASLLLFSRYACGGNRPPTDLVALSRDIVATTGGLPLALVIIGSYLKRKDKSIWTETRDRLRKMSDTEVQEKLKISYDALKDYEKQMFLDIACFFIGTEKRIATYMWKDLQLYPDSGLARMIELSLIKYDEENKLRMHDQLRDLGKAIARSEGSEGSRLWDEEATNVLSRKGENRNIEALSLDEKGSRLFMEQRSFERMPSLKFLRLSAKYFVRNFEDSLSELRWLVWEKCPDSFMPTNVHLEKLLILDLSGDCISENGQGWSSIKMEKLKVLNLSGTLDLESTLNLSALDSLEILTIQDRHWLRRLDLSQSTHLKQLRTSRCRDLEEIKGPLSLEILMIQDCHSLRRLDLLQSTHLKRLRASRCSDLEEINLLTNLEEMEIEACDFIRLDPLQLTTNLKRLTIRRCKGLVEIKGLLSLTNVEELEIEDCHFVKSLDLSPSSPHLKRLRISECSDVEEIKVLLSLTNLEELEIDCFYYLRSLDFSQSTTRLKHLTVSKCWSLVEIKGLSSLTNLTVSECWSLVLHSPI